MLPREGVRDPLAISRAQPLASKQVMRHFVGLCGCSPSLYSMKLRLAVIALTVVEFRLLGFRLENARGRHASTGSSMLSCICTTPSCLGCGLLPRPSSSSCLLALQVGLPDNLPERSLGPTRSFDFAISEQSPGRIDLSAFQFRFTFSPGNPEGSRPFVMQQGYWHSPPRPFHPSRQAPPSSGTILKTSPRIQWRRAAYGGVEWRFDGGWLASFFRAGELESFFEPGLFVQFPGRQVQSSSQISWSVTEKARRSVTCWPVAGWMDGCRNG